MHCKSSGSNQCVNRQTPQSNKATDKVDSNLLLCNRFDILQSYDDQEIFTDTDNLADVSSAHMQCTSPSSGRALPGDDNITWDVFDKVLLKKKVHRDTIAQAKSCDDYLTCKSQMDKPFWVNPLSPLKIYTGAPTRNQNISDPLLVHHLVRASGRPNYLGLRIPLTSNLNISAWRMHLKNYWDQQLVDLLEFGSPLDFDRGFYRRQSCFCQ